MQIEQAMNLNQKISRRLRQLFDQSPQEPKSPRLLHQQPVQQRQLFINRVIRSGQRVFVQLLPINGDGHRINVHASVKRLPDGRFLFQTHNLSYVVQFPQVDYIANL